MKIDDHIGMLQKLWKQGYEQGIPIRNIRKEIGLAGRSDKYWISAQVKLLEEFGYIKQHKGDIWQIVPGEIFPDWDQDAYNRLLQQDREDARAPADPEKTNKDETIPADEMTNEQLRDKIRKLEIGVQAEAEMAKLTQIERDAGWEKKLADDREGYLDTVRDEVGYQIRKETRILIGEELDRRLGKPESHAEVEEEDDDKTMPALPE